MHVAAEHGSTEFLEQLVSRKIDRGVNKADEDARLPIHFAAWKGHADTVKSLIEMGSFVDTPTRTGWTAMHYAAFSGSLDTCKVLLERSNDSIFKLDESQQNPLSVAVRFHPQEREEWEKLFEEFESAAATADVTRSSSNVHMESFEADLREEGDRVQADNLKFLVEKAIGGGAAAPAAPAAAVAPKRQSDQARSKQQQHRLTLLVGGAVALFALAYVVKRPI